MELLTYQAAADIAGCSAPALVKAVKAKKLKIHEIDGKRGFDPDEVRIYAATRHVPLEKGSKAMEAAFDVKLKMYTFVEVEKYRRIKKREEKWNTKNVLMEAIGTYTRGLREMDSELRAIWTEKLFADDQKLSHDEQMETRFYEVVAPLLSLDQNRVDLRFKFALWVNARGELDELFGTSVPGASELKKKDRAKYERLFEDLIQDLEFDSFVKFVSWFDSAN